MDPSPFRDDTNAEEHKEVCGMIWAKSFGVGFLAVLVSIPIGWLLLGLILKVQSGLPLISIDIVALSKNTFVQLTLVVIFALGFLWEHHRIAHG